ncbi:MAG: M13 family peptidase, partial [Sphingomonas sp.]
MKSLIAASLLAATAIAGVTAATSQTSTAKTTGAQYGTFGFDEKGMDRSVAPGDNFYAYANGTWAKTTPIPADKANYGAFNFLSDLSESRTRGILDTAAKDPNSKIGRAYATFLDRAAIDAKGLAPIQPWLTKVKGTTRATYPALVAEASRAGIGGPFGAYFGQDDKQPEIYALSLAQAGLGMPDRDYYLGTDAKLVETKAAYQAH